MDAESEEAMKEGNIVRAGLLRLKGRAVGWINVRGMFLTLDGARKIKAGLMAEGSGDIIGFKTITITQEMVGKKIAQFRSCEVKTSTGRVRPEQRHWADFINENGGKAGIARTPEEIEKIMVD